MNDDAKDMIKAIGLTSLLIGVPVLINLLHNKYVEKQAEKKRDPIAEEMERRKRDAQAKEMSDWWKDSFDTMTAMIDNILDDKSILDSPLTNVFHVVEKYYPDELGVKTKIFAGASDDLNKAAKDLYSRSGMSSCESKVIDGSTDMQKMILEINDSLKVYRLLILQRALEIAKSLDATSSKQFFEFVYDSLLREKVLSKSGTRSVVKNAPELKNSNYTPTITITKYLTNCILNIIEKHYPEKCANDNYMKAMCKEIKESDIFDCDSIGRRLNKFVKKESTTEAATKHLTYFVSECFCKKD